MFQKAFAQVVFAGEMLFFLFTAEGESWLVKSCVSGSMLQMWLKIIA